MATPVCTHPLAATHTHRLPPLFHKPTANPALLFLTNPLFHKPTANPALLFLTNPPLLDRRPMFIRGRRGFSPISASSGTLTTGTSEEDTNLLERVEVLDLTGKAIPICDLWKDRKAVVAFARHFGCVLCRKRADFLASEKEKMDAAGVALVLIGPGSVDQAKSFSDQTKFEGEVYADPNHSSYDALNFVSGISTTFTPSAGWKIIQSYMEGYRQDWGLSFQRDTVSKGGWQQGGIIVAGPGQTNISYIHKDKEAGDEPDIKDILEACCS